MEGHRPWNRAWSKQRLQLCGGVLCSAVKRGYLSSSATVSSLLMGRYGPFLGWAYRFYIVCIFFTTHIIIPIKKIHNNIFYGCFLYVFIYILLCATKSDLFKYLLMCLFNGCIIMCFIMGVFNGCNLNILTLFFYKCVWLKPNNK